MCVDFFSELVNKCFKTFFNKTFIETIKIFFGVFENSDCGHPNLDRQILRDGSAATERNRREHYPESELRISPEGIPNAVAGNIILKVSFESALKECQTQSPGTSS